MELMAEEDNGFSEITHCPQCRAFERWKGVFTFNLEAGMISPNLWFFNVAIIVYFYVANVPFNCIHHDLGHSLMQLMRIAGYSMCGILCYIAVGLSYYMIIEGSFGITGS